MSILTAAQIATINKAAGFSGSNGPVSIAVVLGESSGNTTITNSYVENGVRRQVTGLFQISDVHAGKAGTSKDIATFRTQMKNPVTNVTVAKAIHASSGWQPWEAYTNGSYQRYMAKALEGWSHPADPGSIPGVSFKDFNPITDPGDILDAAQVSLPDPLARVAAAAETIIEVINRAGGWIADRDNWIRIAQIVGGMGLAYVGFQVVVQPYVQPYISGATKTVKKYYTKGVVK